MSGHSKYVQSADGTRIYANAAGDPSKLALIFLHGGLSDQTVFDDIFVDVEFANEFFLIRYDLRGAGRSGKPNTSEGYTSEKYAQDFAAVLQSFGVIKAVLVGWSMGALVLADLATYLPEGVLQGAVCISGTPYINEAAISSFDSALLAARAGIFSADATESRPAILAVNRLLFLRSTGVPPDIIADTAKAVEAGANFVEENPNATWDLRARMLAAALSSSHDHIRLSATRAQDYTRVVELGAKGFPVQLILGGKDAQVDHTRLVGALKPVFTDLRVKIVEGASHTPFVDSPGEVLGTISKFVQSL